MECSAETVRQALLAAGADAGPVGARAEVIHCGCSNRASSSSSRFDSSCLGIPINVSQSSLSIAFGPVFTSFNTL
jgi:hypothetical protein